MSEALVQGLYQMPSRQERLVTWTNKMAEGVIVSTSFRGPEG